MDARSKTVQLQVYIINYVLKLPTIANYKLACNSTHDRDLTSQKYSYAFQFMQVSVRKFFKD